MLACGSRPKLSWVALLDEARTPASGTRPACHDFGRVRSPRLGTRLVPPGSREREPEVDGRSAVGVVRGPEPPAVSADDRPADRESKTHTLRPGREERLEDAIHVLGRDPASPVDDRHVDAFAVGGLGP